MHLRFTNQCRARALSSDAYRPSEGTQWHPSARTVGHFGWSLAGLLTLYALALHQSVPVVGLFCLGGPHVWPRSAGALSSDAFVPALRRHPVGPQCPNCRAFWSVAGWFAGIVGTCTLPISASGGSLPLALGLARTERGDRR